MAAMENIERTFVDSRDFARIARAIGFINERFRDQPRLRDIAAQAGLSEFHFNRLFRRWAGVTPKQYLAFVTGKAARDALDSQPVLDAAFSVGLSGPGRLHDLMVTLEAMTPGELKAQGAGAKIRHGICKTPFGTALIATTARGVCHLAFVESGREAAAVRELAERWPNADLQQDDAFARATAATIWGAGRAALSVHVGGTNFQLQVWRALLDLGARQSTTYTELAAAIGEPRGTRAVGNAVGANPVAWLIPCHRVLRKDGAAGGYRWGAARKQAIHAWSALPAAARNM